MHKRSDIHLPPVRIAYGFDLSDGHAAVVRARLTRGGVHTETIAEARGENLKDALTSAAQSAHAEVALNRAVLSAAMPAKDSMVRWLEAPFPSVSKARKVLPSLLDIELPFPLESCVFGFPHMEKTGEGRVRALAVAARREHVEGRVAACAEMNMDPQCLDHEGLALWTQSLAEIPPSAGRRAVCYLGPDRTVWVLGDRDRIESTHASTMDGATGDAETRHREWRDRALRILRTQMASAGATDMQWIWTGPAAADTERVRALESLLSEAQPNLRFGVHTDPSTFLARALAQRALAQEILPWNFRADTLAHPVMQQWRDGAIRRAAWTALAAGLILCIVNFTFGAILQATQRQADRALAETARTLTGLPSVPRGQERMVAERVIDEQSTQLAPFLDAFQPGQTRTLRGILRTAAAGGLHYESVSLRRDQLLIQGTAGDWDACELLADQLRDEGWDVHLDRQDAVAEEHVRFRLTGGRRS